MATLDKFSFVLMFLLRPAKINFNWAKYIVQVQYTLYEMKIFINFKFSVWRSTLKTILSMYIQSIKAVPYKKLWVKGVRILIWLISETENIS